MVLVGSASSVARGEPPAEPASALPPLVMPYEAGVPPPPGYHLVDRQDEDLMYGGATLFGLAYLPAASFVGSLEVFGIFLPDHGAADLRALYIPLAGPFMLAGRSRLSEAPVKVVGFYLLGAAQVLGILVMVGGLIHQERVWVRNDLPEVALLPTVTSGGAPGLALAGSF